MKHGSGNWTWPVDWTPASSLVAFEESSTLLSDAVLSTRPRMGQVKEDGVT